MPLPGCGREKDRVRCQGAVEAAVEVGVGDGVELGVMAGVG